MNLGRVGAIVQVAAAATLAAVSAMSGDSTGDAVPRPITLLLIYAVPGLIAFIGAVRGRPALLIGVALADIPGALLALSGVTLVFLVPCLLLAAGAAELLKRTPPEATGPAAAVAALVAMLLLGAGTSMLMITRPACWSGGCTSAAITIEGVGLGLALHGLAIAIALWWARPRRSLADAG